MPLPMNTPPIAMGPTSEEALLSEANLCMAWRAKDLRRRLFEPDPTRYPDDESCPSSSSSTNTTPTASLPTTPLDETPPSVVRVLADDYGENSIQPPDDTEVAKRKGSLSRVVKKIGATIRKGSLRKHGNGHRFGDIRDIFHRSSPDKNVAAPSSKEHPVGDPAHKQDAPSIVHIPGAFVHRHPNDSNTSLAAVHGSPTESEWVLAESPDVQKSPTFTRNLSGHVLDAGVLKLFKKALFFMPYVVLVGLAPFMFPSHLSALTFSSTLGYVTRPSTPFRVFAHHIKMLPYHVGIAFGILGLLSFWSVVFAATSFMFVVGATLWAWHDFRLDGAGSGQALGCDDRMSLYWIVKGVVLGDLVCSMGDFERLCGDEDVDVVEGEEEVEEGDFEMLQEADGSIDCTIRVAGPGVDARGAEMRIIVQCVE